VVFASTGAVTATAAVNARSVAPVAAVVTLCVAGCCTDAAARRGLNSGFCIRSCIRAGRGDNRRDAGRCDTVTPAAADVVTAATASVSLSICTGDAAGAAIASGAVGVPDRGTRVSFVATDRQWLWRFPAGGQSQLSLRVQVPIRA